MMKKNQQIRKLIKQIVEKQPLLQELMERQMAVFI